MRISSQMLAQTSRESGIPLAQGSLLDALNKQDTSANILDALEQNRNAKQVSAMQKNYMALETAAEKLNKYTSELYAQGADSLFGRVEEKKETTDILLEVKNMVESYNKTLGLLQNAEGTLNSFYCKELKYAAAENEELLKSVGITQNTNGSLTVDEKVLNCADYDSLKKVFGTESEFTKKASYISSRVAENAAANVTSISSQYNAKGMSNNDLFEANKYNYFG